MKHNFRKELRDVFLKATPARLAVIDLLEKSDKPVDLDTIIDYLKKKSINADPATSFRIINLFTEKGLTKKVQFMERKFRYELASKEDHHHLICLMCESVQDIEDRFMTEWETEIKEKTGFIVINHNLEFFGICRNCQS